jgi:hypothetical protein
VPPQEQAQSSSSQSEFSGKEIRESTESSAFEDFIAIQSELKMKFELSYFVSVAPCFSNKKIFFFFPFSFWVFFLFLLFPLGLPGYFVYFTPVFSKWVFLDEKGMMEDRK